MVQRVVYSLYLTLCTSMLFQFNPTLARLLARGLITHPVPTKSNRKLKQRPARNDTFEMTKGFESFIVGCTRCNLCVFLNCVILCLPRIDVTYIVNFEENKGHWCVVGSHLLLLIFIIYTELM